MLKDDVSFRISFSILIMQHKVAVTIGVTIGFEL